MDCNNKQLSTTYIGNIDVFTLDRVPDFILAEVDVEDPNTGKVIRSMVRVPGAKLFGGGSFDGQTVIEPNNEIEVQESQPLGARIVNNGNYNTVELSNIGQPVDFLIIRKMGAMLVIQASGFVYYPEGHQYIVGQDYYLSDSGLPTTDPTSGVKLFKPISSTKLVITLGR